MSMQRVNTLPSGNAESGMRLAPIRSASPEIDLDQPVAAVSCGVAVGGS
jgi:hypothetical protein